MPVINPSFEERSTVPPGIYRARVLGCDQKTSQRGTTYLNWKFGIEHSDPNLHGQWVYLSTGLTGKGAVMIRQVVRSTIDENYENGAVDTDAITGFPVDIRVEQNFNQDGTPSKYPLVVDVQPASDAVEEDFA